MESVKTEKKKKIKEKELKVEDTPSVINKKRKAEEDENGAISKKTKTKLAGKINDKQNVQKPDESELPKEKKTDKKKKSKKEKQDQEKKKKKKKKQKKIEDETSRGEEISETIDKVEKPSKKKANKAKLHSFPDQTQSIAVDYPSSNLWNNWEKAEFADDSQKQKFLRLLGGRKSNGASAPEQLQKKGLFGSLVTTPTGSTFESAIDSHVAKKVNENLQKQFADGIKLRKQKQMGRKVGLGFTGA